MNRRISELAIHWICGLPDVVSSCIGSIPAVWLLKQELQNVHEYEADESVIAHGVDAKHYQLLLIKKAVGAQRFTSMANSFDHSKLKKRITMMLKQKSNPWARLKFLYVLPLAAVAVAAFARPEISRRLENISEVEFAEVLTSRQDKKMSQAEKDKPLCVLWNLNRICVRRRCPVCQAGPACHD